MTKTIGSFARFARDEFKSGRRGNNFGKNQVAELILELALEYSEVVDHDEVEPETDEIFNKDDLLLRL